MTDSLPPFRYWTCPKCGSVEWARWAPQCYNLNPDGKTRCNTRMI